MWEKAKKQQQFTEELCAHLDLEPTWVLMERRVAEDFDDEDILPCNQVGRGPRLKNQDGQYLAGTLSRVWIPVTKFFCHRIGCLNTIQNY